MNSDTSITCRGCGGSWPREGYEQHVAFLKSIELMLKEHYASQPKV